MTPFGRILLTALLLMLPDQTHADTTYIRWGRWTCPSGIDTVYDGYAAGSWYTHPGAGSNFLCLPKAPKKGPLRGSTPVTFIYGTEYQTNSVSAIFTTLHDKDVPCTVCRRSGKSTTIMIAGTYSCLGGYDREYYGYLMAGKHTHASSNEYICVDKSAWSHSNNANQNGALLYPVESRCGSLPCSVYEDRLLYCAVCSY